MALKQNLFESEGIVNQLRQNLEEESNKFELLNLENQNIIESLYNKIQDLEEKINSLSVIQSQQLQQVTTEKENLVNKLTDENNLLKYNFKIQSENYSKLNDLYEAQKKQPTKDQFNDYQQKKIEELESKIENQSREFAVQASKLTEKIAQLVKFKEDCIGCQFYEEKVWKLVELEKNPLLKQINFAIERLLYHNSQNQIQNSEWKALQFSLYKIQVCDQFNQTYFNKNNEIKEINVQQFCTLTSHHESFKGEICTEEFTAESHSYDSIYLVKHEQKKKLYAIRYVKSYPINQRFQEDTALNISIGLRISQNFLNSFNEELKKCGMNAPEFLKFKEPVIITKQASFKQYFLKYAGSLQIFKKLEEYVINLNDQESNRLYEDLNFFFFEEKDVFWFQQKKDNLKQIFHSSSENELEELKLYLSEIQNFSFPNKEYYAAYEIEKLNGVQMIKYDEDHLDNMKTQIGKFLQAFSYYTIVRSHRKLCVSRFKRVGNILYDPLISTYDGLLNKLDQGIHEIRQIESKFETAKPDDVDYSYLEKIGIKINRQQQFIQGQQKQK